MSFVKTWTTRLINDGEIKCGEGESERIVMRERVVKDKNIFIINRWGCPLAFIHKIVGLGYKLQHQRTEKIEISYR